RTPRSSNLGIPDLSVHHALAGQSPSYMLHKDSYISTLPFLNLFPDASKRIFTLFYSGDCHFNLQSYIILAVILMCFQMRQAFFRTRFIYEHCCAPAYNRTFIPESRINVIQSLRKPKVTVGIPGSTSDRYGFVIQAGLQIWQGF